MKKNLLIVLMTTLCCFTCHHSASAEEPITTYSYHAEGVVDGFKFRIYLPNDFEKTLRGYAYLVGYDKSEQAAARSNRPKRVCIDIQFWDLYLKLGWEEFKKRFYGSSNEQDNQANNSETKPNREKGFSFGVSAGLARKKTNTKSNTSNTPSKQSYFDNSNTTTSVPLSYNIDPDAICTFELKLIGNGAFEGMTDLTEIEIPNTVTTIWPNAFKECTNLKKVIIPESVVSIGWGVFQGCTSLESITIPESVASIGDVAFRNCTSLRNFTFPESVVSIGWGALWGCKNLESITLPNNLHEIPAFLFEDCPALKTVNIPTSMTSINSDAFRETSLQTITIPEGIKLIDSGAFAFCENLQTVIIPKSLKHIATGAFNGCTSLQNIELNEGLEIIEEGAFSDSGIRHLTIPSTIKEIPEYTFQQCEQLESIVLPEGLEKLGMMAFYCCTSLKTIKIPNSLKRLNEKTFIGCSNLTKVEFDGGSQLKYIGPGCFAMCSSLREFDMPDCVTEIDDDSNDGVYMFMDTPIERLKMSASLASFPPLYLDETLKEISFGKNSRMTTIGEYAFSNYKLLKHFQFPDNLNKIEARAFEGCENLEELIFPKTLKTIENSAFSGCIGLTSVNFPSSMTNIGIGVFDGCKGLTSITIPNSVTSIGNGAFYNCSGLQSVNIPNSVTSIGNYAFYKCSSLAEVIIPASVTSIGKFALYTSSNNLRVKSLIMNPFSYEYQAIYPQVTLIVPDGTKEKYKETSYWNQFYTIMEESGLKVDEKFRVVEEDKYIDVKITNTDSRTVEIQSVLGIHVSLTGKVVLPSYVKGPDDKIYTITAIGKSGMYGRDMKWTSIVLPSTVTTIGNSAFSSSPTLKDITIPASVTSIGESAFATCTALESVTVKAETPISIPESTFKNTSNLTTLYVPKGSESAYRNAPVWGDIKNIIGIDMAALGDINEDGEVDVTDVVELIDMVLAGSNDPAGDINGDGEVDVTDVVELIDIVLGN